MKRENANARRKRRPFLQIIIVVSILYAMTIPAKASSSTPITLTKSLYLSSGSGNTVTLRISGNTIFMNGLLENWKSSKIQLQANNYSDGKTNGYCYETKVDYIQGKPFEGSLDISKSIGSYRPYVTIYVDKKANCNGTGFYLTGADLKYIDGEWYFVRHNNAEKYNEEIDISKILLNNIAPNYIDLSNKIVANAKSDYEKIKLIYIWVAENTTLIIKATTNCLMIF